MKLAIILFLISTQAIAQQLPWVSRGAPDKTNIAVRAFGQKLVLPWACEITPKSGLSMNQIEIHCDSLKKPDVISIYFSLPDNCVGNNFLNNKSDKHKVKQEIQNKVVNGKWLYEASYKLVKREDLIFVRVVKDSELCMTVSTSDRELAIKATEVIWQ